MTADRWIESAKARADMESWAKAAAVRALKTGAQTLATLIGTGAVAITDLDWPQMLAVTATSMVLSALTSVAGIPEVATARARRNLPKRLTTLAVRCKMAGALRETAIRRGRLSWGDCLFFVEVEQVSWRPGKPGLFLRENAQRCCAVVVVVVV